jgi:hypothetical protein
MVDGWVWVSERGEWVVGRPVGQGDARQLSMISPTRFFHPAKSEIEIEISVSSSDIDESHRIVDPP